MNDPTTTANTAVGLAGGTLITVIIVGLVILVFTVWAYVNIIRRAGFSGWWVLISLVPIVGTVMFFVFAFVEWPVMREVRQLRTQFVGGQPGYGAPGYPPPAGPYRP